MYILEGSIWALLAHREPARACWHYNPPQLVPPDWGYFDYAFVPCGIANSTQHASPLRLKLKHIYLNALSDLWAVRQCCASVLAISVHEMIFSSIFWSCSHIPVPQTRQTPNITTKRLQHTFEQYLVAAHTKFGDCSTCGCCALALLPRDPF